MKHSKALSLLPVFFLFYLLLVATVPNSSADLSSPASQVRDVVRKIKKVVGESQGKVSAVELDKRLTGLIAPLFDFREMSRRSLGAAWKQASDDEKKEFVDLFSELLSRTYLTRIRENVSVSDVKVISERIKKKKAIVRTKVDSEGQKAVIDYRLRVKGEKWMVYDVVIENVGLVSNYRSEFASEVKLKGVSGVIAKLREMQAASSKEA